MTERFTIKKSELKPGYWVCADSLNGLICTFKDKTYNDDQKFSLYEDVKPDPGKLATAAREMGDWLRENHYDKIF